MIDRFKRLLLAFAVLVGGLGTLAVMSPAQAAAADCPSGMFCIWVDGNYSGARYQISTNSLIDGVHNGVSLPDWIDDKGSALYNRTNSDVYVFDGGNCGSVGWNRLIPVGQRLTAPGSAINDRISSIQRWNAYPLGCS